MNRELQSAGPKNTLSYIVDDVIKVPYDRYELPFIGLAIEKLVGSGFRSSYTSAVFKAHYSVYRKTVVGLHELQWTPLL